MEDAVSGLRMAIFGCLSEVLDKGGVVAFSFPWRGFVDCCHQPGMKPIARIQCESHSSSGGTCRLTHKGRAIRCCLPTSRGLVDESRVGEAAIANHGRRKRCDQGKPAGKHGRRQQAVLSFFFPAAGPRSLAGRDNHDAAGRRPRIWTQSDHRGVTLTSRCTRK